MTKRVPASLRAAMLLERIAAAAHRRCTALTQRVALTRIAPERWSDVTAAMYSTQTSFAPGGEQFAAGLFDWERDAFEHPLFPRTGTVLVGGAGGGRELVALADRGYRVVGFEPAEGLVRRAREATASLARVELLRGSYEELVAAWEGKDATLRRVVDAAPYDAVVLGWGSLSHVLDVARRDALFAALRALSPTAPVLMTYMRHADGVRGSGAQGQVRFASHAGYYRTMSNSEVAALAHRAGYDLAVLSVQSYPHALLAPRP